MNNEKNKELDIKKMDDELNLVPASQIEGVYCLDVSEEEMEWLLEFGEKLVAKCALSGGAGLAACQVGINKRVFAWMFKEGLYQIAVNPVYYKDGKNTNTVEGCLSYPGEQYFVTRHKYIRAVYYSVNRNTKKLVKICKILRDEAAIIYQHETDHCNGITIAMKGKLFKKAVAPQQIKQEENEEVKVKNTNTDSEIILDK
ncbi:MAG TPA: peptide deformylase [Candidatus Paceibacterota bacterium]|nr:peptide deformylase [Candidatus Paceibacterota bacterium]